MLVGGQAVTTYEDEEGEAVNVRVRLPQALRGDVRAGRRPQDDACRPRTGPALVPLTDLVTFTRATSPAEISRRDLTRQVTVDANLDNLPLGTAGTLAMEAGETLKMAPGYKLVLGGDTEMMVESFGYMAEALLLAVIFVYLILAAQFESFIDPLSIMLSLPLSIVGMAGTLRADGRHDQHHVAHRPHHADGPRHQERHPARRLHEGAARARAWTAATALITAGRTRLRPILMTTSAMIFGMLPLFFALGEGAEFRAPMARAVVGGLITSTLLTLIVVPVVYTILDDIIGVAVRPEEDRWPPRAPRRLSMAVLAACGPAGAGAAGHRIGRGQRRRRSPGAAGRAGRSAATAPAGVKVLTLDQALAIAAAQNRDVQKAIEYQNWVQGKYLEERAAALPQVTFTGQLRCGPSTTARASCSAASWAAAIGGVGATATNIGEIFGGRQDVSHRRSSGVTQVVFTWGQVGAAIRAAKLGFELSDQQLRRFRQAVAKDVTTAFYDVLVARELVRIAEEDLAQKQRHLDESTKRQAAGTATDYDVLAAQVAVENAQPAVIRGAERRAGRARAAALPAGRDRARSTSTGTLAAPVEPVPAYDELLAHGAAEPAGTRARSDTQRASTTSW